LSTVDAAKVVTEISTSSSACRTAPPISIRTVHLYGSSPHRKDMVLFARVASDNCRVMTLPTEIAALAAVARAEKPYAET
jgi:hypothetical protein